MLYYTKKRAAITGLTLGAARYIFIISHFHLFCKGHFAQSLRIYSLSRFGFSSEHRLETSPDQRLDKEKLREECEREIKADELYPVGKECQHIERRYSTKIYKVFA